MTLSVAVVCISSAPGGSIVPFIQHGIRVKPVIGRCHLLLSWLPYITGVRFGTACNVSGDNAIGVIIGLPFIKFIAKHHRRIKQNVFIGVFDVMGPNDRSFQFSYRRAARIAFLARDDHAALKKWNSSFMVPSPEHTKDTVQTVPSPAGSWAFTDDMRIRILLILPGEQVDFSLYSK